MFRIDTPNNVAVLPAPAAVGLQGFFQDTDPAGSTSLTADFFNHVQEALCRTIEASGQVLNKANFDQMTNAVAGAAALRSHAADTGSVTTLHTRAVLASTTSRADNPNSVVAGSVNGYATGDQSAVIACNDCDATNSESAVVASGIVAAASPAATGQRSFVAASGGAVAATATESVVLASGAPAAAAGIRSLVAACDGSSTAAQASAVIASNAVALTGTRAAAIACDTGTNASGAVAAVIASSGTANASGASAAVVASRGTSATPGTACFAGGTQGVSIGGVECAAVAALNSTTTATAMQSAALASATATIDDAECSAVIAGITDTIQGVDPGDAPTRLAIVASGTSVIEGRPQDCAIIASAGSDVRKGVAVANLVTESAIIGCVQGGVSGLAAGGAQQSAVLMASRSTELAPDAAWRSWCVAGGWSAGAQPAAGTSANLKWLLDSVNGNIRLAGAVNPGPPDFAELFPNESRGILPDGALVSRRGRKVRLAQPGDRVLGIVSADPGIVCGDSGLEDRDRWERTEFGRRIIRDHGEAGIGPVEREGWQSGGYIPLAERPQEWTIVGLLGQIRARVDHTVREDDFVAAGLDGLGTRGNGGDRIECLEIVVPYDLDRGYAVALCLVR